MFGIYQQKWFVNNIGLCFYEKYVIVLYRMLCNCSGYCLELNEINLG
jgi:hypothetical protein